MNATQDEMKKRLVRKDDLILEELKQQSELMQEVVEQNHTIIEQNEIQIKQEEKFINEWHLKHHLNKKWLYFSVFTSLLSIVIMSIAALNYPEETAALISAGMDKIQGLAK